MNDKIVDINEENWGYCAYEVGNLLAMVTLGAEMDKNGMNELFFVSLFNEDFQSRFQKTYYQLNDALSCINSKYGGMAIKNLTQKGGCDSCDNLS